MDLLDCNINDAILPGGTRIKTNVWFLEGSEQQSLKKYDYLSESMQRWVLQSVKTDNLSRDSSWEGASFTRVCGSDDKRDNCEVVGEAIAGCDAYCMAKERSINLWNKLKMSKIIILSLILLIVQSIENFGVIEIIRTRFIFS